jgi:2-methylisocitrate lyase-like PEP mutase family enzyme
MTESDTYALFRALHRAGEPLALVNAWDVATARLTEQAGVKAVATTSGGVAWSLGSPDGGRLDRSRAIDLVARIVAAVRVPVTADIEEGYASDADGVADTIKAVVAAGAVGVNLEDSAHGEPEPLLPVTEAAARIAAARRAAGSDLFINARIDTYLQGAGEPATRQQDTVDRAHAYVDAGADGIFVPGVVDPAVIAELVRGVGAPLNVMAHPGSPTLAELGLLGVARVSLGSGVAQTAYATVRRAATEFLTAGTYDSLGEAVGYAELNELLST